MDAKNNVNTKIKFILSLFIIFPLIMFITIPLPTKLFANSSSCTLSVTPAMAGLETTIEMHFENCETYVINVDISGYGPEIGVINNSPEDITNNLIFPIPGQYTINLKVFIDASGGPGIYNPAEDTLICQKSVTFTIPENPNIGINIDTNGNNAVIEIFNKIADLHSGSLIIIKFCGTYEELLFLGPEAIDKVVVEEFWSGDPDGKVYNLSLPDGGYFALLEVSGPDVKVTSIKFFTIGKGCGDDNEPAWVRTMPMTCWQVWINEDNNFEFIFWWVYGNNNWVQIFDMEGNLVWETDFPKDKPHFEVDLPDGMYKVQTFHEAGKILQEFYIGKPGPEM